MSIEPYALANSRSSAFPAVRAEPNLLQRLHPLSAPQRAELYFGRVAPVLQYRPDMFGALRLATLCWNIPGSTLQEDSTPHNLGPALERPWPRASGDTYCRDLLGGTTILFPHHAAATRRLVANRTAKPPLPVRLSFVHTCAPKPPTPGAQSFLSIERVKHLLGQQKIRDARRTLELASVRYPADAQIASLLRAISPGRVSPTGRAAASRERETAWIRQHGHKYRGQWIALDEDRLIAFAPTLKELLADMDATDEREEPPFIQHLLSE